MLAPEKSASVAEVPVFRNAVAITSRRRSEAGSDQPQGASPGLNDTNLSKAQPQEQSAINSMLKSGA